jgi:hypothetical protein
MMPNGTVDINDDFKIKGEKQNQNTTMKQYGNYEGEELT